jgi:ubiquinone/menaquinone biosynthesis C-methylase UbiE
LKRGITNFIRKAMDEWLPPVIRDNRIFMYPFFWYWFKGKNIKLYMDFKVLSNHMSEEELAACYKNLDCRATDRPTDLNETSTKQLLKRISPTASTLLDVGCGRGYWLKLLQQKTGLQLMGCDVFDFSHLSGIDYKKGTINQLPFEDKSFDIVTCHHTLEHIKDINAAVRELKRVARKQLMVVVPKQRYYYYTLDLHLHFFPLQHHLTNLIGLPDFECIDCNGDWCYIANVQ